MNESGRLCLQILCKTSYFCSCKWIIFSVFYSFITKSITNQWKLKLKNVMIAP